MEIIQQNMDSLSLITKAEIDTQISTAKAFPRSIKTFLDKAMSIATISEDIADSCNYALARGGKTIEGPSIRLAEIVASSYGNIRYGGRVISNDGRKITAQGICHDLETNTCVTIEVSRSILQHEWKGGSKTGNMITMNEDMQIVTGNAATAIAVRNAIFKVVPSALIDPIYQETKKLLKGTAETLPAKRDKALQHLRGMGVKDSQICTSLGIKRVEDIDLEKLSVLRGMVSAIKNGESTVKDMFDPEPEQKIPAALSRAMELIDACSASDMVDKIVSDVPLIKFTKEYQDLFLAHAASHKEKINGK